LFKISVQKHRKDRIGFTWFQSSYKQRSSFFWQSYDRQTKEQAKHTVNIKNGNTIQAKLFTEKTKMHFTKAVRVRC